jgi:hypothetical protein
MVMDLDAMVTYNAAAFFHHTVASLLKPRICSSNSSYSEDKQPEPVNNEEMVEIVEFADEEFEYVNIGLGSMSLFSVFGLQNFAKDVYYWFNGTAEDVHSRCHAFHPHFSDMILLKGFAKSNPALRSSCLEQYPLPKCIAHRMGCVPLPNYASIIAQHPHRHALFKFQNRTITKWSSTENAEVVAAGAATAIKKPMNSLEFWLYPSDIDLPFCVMVSSSLYRESLMIYIVRYSIFKEEKLNICFICMLVLSWRVLFVTILYPKMQSFIKL